MIEVQVNDGQFKAALQHLLNQAGTLKPALSQIGEQLTESTRQRFATKTAPDGTHWADNSPLTQQRKGRNDPLIGESGARGGLLGSFSYNASTNTLVFGNSLEYAAVQHFGARQGQFGTSKRNGPLPWGNIPARPFLGISNKDEADIFDIIKEHLLASV